MTRLRSPRVIAIDWSGAKSGQRSKIWLAEIRDGVMTRLESGRSRAEVTDHVIEEGTRHAELVVGLDFAFSLPEWFLTQLGIDSVEDLWREVGRRGEDWLDRCEPPFWGRPGKKKPELPSDFRVTEETAHVAGIGAKSAFQIGGAGAVGTGSLRGMPYLETLRSAGWSIWPFHAVRFPLVIEIYPRLLTGPVKKSRQVDRERYLSAGFPEIVTEHMGLAASSEDAFDAAVSAVIMARHVEELSGLQRAVDATERLEGRIWAPPEGSPTTASAVPSSHASGSAPPGSLSPAPARGELAGSMSPTIFRAKGLRFFFFSLEEARMHVHVLGEEGEAKVWIEPEIELAKERGLSKKMLAFALKQIEEHEGEIREAWSRHFGR